MSAFLPLFIDLEDRKITIFGGGSVGERKAKLFSAGRVTVVSPAFTPALETMGQRGIISLERRAVSATDILELVKGSFLVIAATSDEALNDEIKRIAEASGILVNSVTGESGVIVPSVIRKGDICIGISTGGKSPAMSKYIRMKIEPYLSDDCAAMVRLQAEMRESLRKAIPDQKERERVLWETLGDAEVWEALKVSYERALDIAMDHIHHR